MSQIIYQMTVSHNRAVWDLNISAHKICTRLYYVALGILGVI